MLQIGLFLRFSLKNNLLPNFFFPRHVLVKFPYIKQELHRIIDLSFLEPMYENLQLLIKVKKFGILSLHGSMSVFRKKRHRYLIQQAYLS